MSRMSPELALFLAFSCFRCLEVLGRQGEISMIREPNALDAAAYVGMKVAEYGAYSIFGVVLFGFAVATGWLG